MTAELTFSINDFSVKITAPDLATAYAEYRAFIDTQVNDDSFRVKRISPSVIDGKTYWKAKGGAFQKYGVTIWDEVGDECGLPLKTLDARRDYIPPAGTIAEVVRGDDGKVKKVSRLVFPSDSPENAIDHEDFVTRIGKEINIAEPGTIREMIRNVGFSSYRASLKAAIASALRHRIGGG